MKTKHVFVPALDVNEALPFVVTSSDNLNQMFQEMDDSKKELTKFIDILEKNFKENIYYMGIDVIGEKSYERFIFDKGGFLEIMVEAPIAIIGHFVHEKRAKKFSLALKKTISKIMKGSPVKEMFIDSINIQTEEDTSLTVKKWHKLKNIRE